jgi:hypothetical protein
MAHQFPNQLRNRGTSGQRLYDSIMETASSKVVFRLAHEENLMAMAKWLFMGVMDPDEIKHELYSTKVMSYREEEREVISEGRSSSRSSGKQRGGASGRGRGGTEAFYDEEETLETTESDSEFASSSESASESRSEGSSWSRSTMQTIIPVMGQELSHVQFRSLEEQLFRAMAILFNKEERHGVARLVGMKAPVTISTPTIEKIPATAEFTKRFLDRYYEKLPFALSGAVAQKQLADREENFVRTLFEEAANAPEVIKRKIR